MPKQTVTMLAKTSNRYDRANLKPGKTFQAREGDVETLKLLGWAEDVPTKPVKSGTYQTADLKPAA